MVPRFLKYGRWNVCARGSTSTAGEGSTYTGNMFLTFTAADRLFNFYIRNNFDEGIFGRIFDPLTFELCGRQNPQ